MATPAAVLSIMVKAQGIQATSAQLGVLDKSAHKAARGISATEANAKRGSATLAKFGTVAKVGAAAGVAALAVGMKTAVSEFREAQKVGAQTNAVLKSTGNAAKTTKKHIEGLAGAISRKSGIDDEAIQTGANLLLTFKEIRNEQGKGNKIFDQATQVITDMSVAMNQGLKPSAIQVGKALNDPVKGMTALGRVGVTFTEGQKKQVAALVESGNKLAAQKIILRELKSEFAGSAAAQATAGDKLKVALGNLAEAAGGVLVPVLDKAAVAMTNLINDFVEGKGIATFIIPVFNKLRDSVAGTVAWIKQLSKDFNDGDAKAVLLVSTVAGLTAGFVAFKTVMIATAIAAKTMAAAQVLLNIALDANPVGVIVVSLAALGVAFTVAYQKSQTFRAGVLKVTAAALGIITTMIDAEGQVARLAGSLIPGRDAMDRFADKAQVAADRLNGLRERLREQASPFHSLNVAAKDLGDSLVTNMQRGRTGADALGHSITDVSTKFDGLQRAADAALGTIGGALKKQAGPLKAVGDGIGIPKMGGGAPGKGSAALMGANSSLAPFARVGAGFGLHVSSGLRPGAITSSGNPSYHGTGEAIDLADGTRGPSPGKLAAFSALRSKFGGRLAELIYTPGGVGIKNGQPYTYTGKVAADHMDHVHVAFDTGKPGPGDGIGKTGGARKALTGDGIGVAVEAARRAGFRGTELVNMVAIAGRESGWDPTETNFKPPDHSIGLWQINQLAHHGKYGTDSQLKNPYTNAKAARALFKLRGYQPWHGFAGVTKSMFAKARAAVKGSKGGAGSKAKGPGVSSKTASDAAAHGTRLRTQSEAAFNAMNDERLAQETHNQGIAAALQEEADHRRNMGQGDDEATSAMDDLTEQLRITNEKLTLQTQLAQETLKKYNVSQSQYGVLAKAIASVASGEIGGKIGLGFMSPGFSGGGSRY